MMKRMKMQVNKQKLIEFSRIVFMELDFFITDLVSRMYDEADENAGKQAEVNRVFQNSFHGT